MNTVTIWLLIAISNGMHSRGTVTVVERFATGGDCALAIVDLKSQPDSVSSVYLRRIPAKVAKVTP